MSRDDVPADRSVPVVLLVEDEILIRYDAAEILREAGLSVIEAGNGAEALELLNSGLTVNLLVSDINMPGTPDGLALAAIARDLRPGLPVVLATAVPPADAGEVRTLPKPYAASELLGIVTTMLESTWSETTQRNGQAC